MKTSIEQDLDQRSQLQLKQCPFKHGQVKFTKTCPKVFRGVSCTGRAVKLDDGTTMEPTVFVPLLERESLCYPCIYGGKEKA